MLQKKDVFISYRNDGIGDSFADELYHDLDEMGYSVYYSPIEARSNNFPERLKRTIEMCRDFICVVTESYIRELQENKPTCWVREELLIANENDKNIIPLLINGTTMPTDFNLFPEELQFFPKIDAKVFPKLRTEYKAYPFGELVDRMNSNPERDCVYRDVFNSNTNYNVRRDFLETLKKAEAGDIPAQYEVGIMYYFAYSKETDDISEENYANAARWFEKVAASDSDLSKYANTMLGKMYFAGVIPRKEQSFEKSLECYLKAYEDPYSHAKADLLTLQGLGCDFDYNELEKKADYCKVYKDAALTTEIASIYASYGQFNKAIELYESLELLTPEAEYQLGLLYKKGVHVFPPQPHYQLAENHFRNAFDTGHLYATYELGNLYFNPTGRFRKNFLKAKEYFKIAADKGHGESQYRMGWICEYGLAGTVDYDMAISYYEKAVGNGHILASLQLSQLYQYASCCNYHKAFFHAVRAANAGCDLAQFILGNLYFFGRGCMADVDKAYEWYQKAYQNGLYQAKVMMDKIDNIYA